MRTSRRRTSRPAPNGRRRGSRGRGGRGKVEGQGFAGFKVRKGSISGPGFVARENTRFPELGRNRIMVERGGFAEFPSPSQFGRIAREEGIPSAAVTAAFGHMKGLKAVAQESSEAIDSVTRPRAGAYGSSKHIKIGHFDATGALRGGLRRGQLILFEQRGPDHQIIWGVAEVPEDKTMLRDVVSKRLVPISTAGNKAQSKFNIPAPAFIGAFSHLLKPSRSTAPAQIHRRPRRR